MKKKYCKVISGAYKGRYGYIQQVSERLGMWYSIEGMYPYRSCLYLSEVQIIEKEGENTENDKQKI